MLSKPVLSSNHISNYTVEKLIGYGGFCNVYKIREISTGKTYAKKEYTNLNFKISDIQKEIKINKIISKCNSLYTIKYICSNMENTNEDLDEKYIIFELASKGALFDYLAIKNKGLSDINCKIIIYKVIKALQVLKANGICHRDIDPQNIFLDGERYQIKLGDFGLSEFIYDENGNKKLSKSKKGKKNFKAPEILNGKKDDEYDGEKADIYSIGVLLFVLRICIYPFLKTEFYSIFNEDEQRYWKIINELIEKKYNSIIEFDPQFKDLFKNLVNPIPSKRITFEEILDHPYIKEVTYANEAQFSIYEDNLIEELNSRFQF